MSVLAALGRTLADLDDQDSWEAAHQRIIGSYLAASFARPESVHRYVSEMLAPKKFKGSSVTARGNEWEPLLLGYAGADPNRLLIHSPENARFAATVDGTVQTATGFGLVETKLKHEQIVTAPTLREIRQIAWQLWCIPEATHIDWVWGEVVKDPTEPGGWRLRRDPLSIRFERDHPQIVAAQAAVLPIATDVLAAYDAALLEVSPF